ncbi:MAG: DUF6655 family protein [Planctomycetota bacterium]
MCRTRPGPAIRPVTSPRRLARCAGLLCAAVTIGGFIGCGKTMSNDATQQLLTADSIDRAVAELDLSPFAGRSVYLQTQLLEHKKLDGVGVGGQNYLIGSLRQHLMAAGALLEAREADAEFVIEARAGAVGSDSHEVTYGMPANSLLSSAASFVPNSPPLPVLPELSVARQQQEHAATKLRLFAYHRERREIVWQSGEAKADSRASHTWLFGAGPFEKGAIYDGTRFAGDQVKIVPNWLRKKDENAFDPVQSLADYNESKVYGLDPPPEPLTGDPGVRLAGGEEPAKEPNDAGAAASDPSANGGSSPPSTQ